MPPPVARRVHGRQPVDLAGRQEEVRVVHAERAEQPLAEERAQRLPADLLDHRAQDVGVVAVDPRLAGVAVERQLGQPRHDVADRLVAVREIPAGDARLLPFIGRRTVAVADAGGVRQQVADGDGPLRRNDVVAAAVVRFGHGRLHELREVLADRIGDQQPPLLLQQHHADAGQGLRLRRDPEYRVRGQRRARLLVAVADGLHVGNLSAAGHDRHGAGQAVVVDVRLERGGQPLQPLGGHADRLGDRDGQALRQRSCRRENEDQECGECHGTDACLHGTTPPIRC